MAKARNYFGLRTGSTKSKTFSILNGWQIEKDRVYGGKNPRTNAQMRQRMVMATASAAYSGMREICDHSFEGVTYGQPTMSKFISENAKMLLKGLLSGNSNIAFNPYQDRSLYPNPYIVSKGSLTCPLYISEMIDMENGKVLVLLKGFTITEQTTLSQFMTAIGLNMNSYITILLCNYVNETKYGQFGWLRLLPKAEKADNTIVDVEMGELFDYESNVPVDLLATTFEPGVVSLIIDFDQYGNYLSGAIIASRKMINWKRTSATMVVENFGDGNPSPAEQALATYPVGTDYVLNGGSI